jgi:hypothetical protein
MVGTIIRLLMPLHYAGSCYKGYDAHCTLLEADARVESAHSLELLQGFWCALLIARSCSKGSIAHCVMLGTLTRVLMHTASVQCTLLKAVTLVIHTAHCLGCYNGFNADWALLELFRLKHTVLHCSTLRDAGSCCIGGIAKCVLLRAVARGLLHTAHC